jgi:hypothetical protein
LIVVQGILVVALMASLLQAEGDAALNDAILLAVEQVAAQPHSRRPVILLRDGSDTVSEASLDEAISQALISNISVFAVGPSSADPEEASLQRLTEEIGVFHGLAESSALEDPYDSLARRSQAQLKPVFCSPGAGVAGEGHQLKLAAQINREALGAARAIMLPKRCVGEERPFKCGERSARPGVLASGSIFDA